MILPAEVTVDCHQIGFFIRRTEALSYVYVYSIAGINWFLKLTLNVSMPEETENKEIVVFDEADKDENQNKVIVRLKAGYITTINIKYTQSMAAKASVSEWQPGEEHTFE